MTEISPREIVSELDRFIVVLADDKTVQLGNDLTGTKRGHRLSIIRVSLV